jgi:hypothetical protein
MPSPNPTTRRQYSETAVPTTLSAAIVDGTDSSFHIASSSGWPDGSVGKFVVTIDRGGSEERILCLSRSGSVVTVDTRGFNGTTAQAHASGVTAECTLSAFDANEWNAHTNASAAVHGAAGSVVGTSDAQTLTNKAMDGGSNTFTNIAQSATHASPDTDASTSALHHTIGTGANQASAGNHTHTDLADTGWANYTPVWTGATTNPVLNDGSIAGRYKQIGKTVFVEFYLKAGASTTFGSGNWSFTLPVTADSTHLLGASSGHISGLMWSQDASVPAAFSAQVVTAGATFHIAGGDSTLFFDSATPFAWATNDNVRGSFFYEAA